MVISPTKVVELINTAEKQTNSKPQETRTALQFMYDTAARRKGVAFIEWQDFWRDEFQGKQLDDNELIIHWKRSKSKITGVVEVSQDTLRRLQSLEQERENPSPQERIFFADLKRSSARQKIYNEFKKAAASIGWPEVSPHWFRHSRLTHLGQEMLKEGHDYPYVKERLRKYGRHESSDTTEDYIELLKRQDQEKITKYSNIEW